MGAPTNTYMHACNRLYSVGAGCSLPLAAAARSESILLHVIWLVWLRVRADQMARRRRTCCSAVCAAVLTPSVLLQFVCFMGLFFVVASGLLYSALYLPPAMGKDVDLRCVVAWVSGA